MNQYEAEITYLRDEVAKMQMAVAKRDGDIIVLNGRIRALETKIADLEHWNAFYKDQANINLADNRRLRHIMSRDPYDDDFYNEL